MRRILLITTDLKVGGSQQHLVLFANYLTKHKWLVTLINLSTINDLATRLDNEVNLINIPRKTSYDFSASKQITVFIKHFNITTIFCNGLFSYLFILSSSYKFKLNISVIFHITLYRSNYDYYKDLAARALLKPDVKLIGISTKQISTLAALLKIPESRFSLVYNGVATSLFNLNAKEVYNKNNADLKAKLNIAESDFVIIKVARFDVEKNHEMALDVIEVIKEKYFTNFVVLFVGGGNEVRLTEIKSIVTQKGLDNHVRFVGIQADVKPYLSVSDLFILTSKSIETFSIAALEAMGFGLPCILTDLGGAKEMIIEGKNGYTVPKFDVDLFAERINDAYSGKLNWTAAQISKNILDNYDAESTYLKLIEDIKK